MTENTTDAGATTTPETTRRRASGATGAVLVVGSVLLMAGAALQQRQDIPRGDALGVLAFVDARPWWSTAALAAVLGMLCWAMALPALGRAMTDDVARTVARLAGPALAVAVAVFAVEYAHDGYSSAALARRWADGAGTAAVVAGDQRMVEILVGGTSMLAQTLIGFALSGFALAMLWDRQYPRALSWLGIVGTAGWFLAGAALFVGLPGSSFAVLLPFSALTMIWVLIVGLVLVRRGVSRG